MCGVQCSGSREALAGCVGYNVVGAKVRANVSNVFLFSDVRNVFKTFLENGFKKRHPFFKFFAVFLNSID